LPAPPLHIIVGIQISAQRLRDQPGHPVNYPPDGGAMTTFFQSIATYFVGARRDGPRAGTSRQALSYTHDAFSLPTHSPTTSQLDALPHSRGPSAFSYPPATSGTNPDDAFTPYSSSDRLNRSSQGAAANSLLPMYQPRSASLNHPSLDKTWSRIRTWLASEYPELGDTLNYGILPEALAEIELNLGVQLPRAVRESYLVVDGQEAESSAGCSEGLFFGLTFLPLETVLEEWRFWREVDDDPATGANSQLRETMQSVPEGWIRREYSCRGWIPLITDKAGNYIGVDLSPPPRPVNPDGSPSPEGSPGQVIIFGRDFDTKIVLWRGDGESGWARWLASFMDELESGEGFEVRGADSDRDGTDSDSEDSVGYEGYYFSGNGGGKGGDAGSGGSMRFTGEYKGWNAIEVWADRSYKKWYAAGLIKDHEPTVEATSAGTSQAISATAVEPLTSALIANITSPSESDNSTLDLATPTALVAVPPSSSVSDPPTDPSTSTASTLPYNPSHPPFLPSPTSNSAPIDSKKVAEDLLSLTSPGPSSWTTIEASSSAPVPEPSTSVPVSNEPLVPVPPSLPSALVEVKPANAPPIPAALEVPVKEDLEDALPLDAHTIRLVSGQATFVGSAADADADADADAEVTEESHELELVSPIEPPSSSAPKTGVVVNDAKRKGFGALSKLGVGGKRKDTVS